MILIGRGLDLKEAFEAKAESGREDHLKKETIKKTRFSVLRTELIAEETLCGFQGMEGTERAEM